MSHRYRIVLAAAFVLVLAATPLLALDTREVNFPQDVTVGGQEIQKGWYDLQWKTSGDGAVEVRILRKGKLIATASGRLVQSEARAKSDRVLYRVENGKRALAEIHTAGSSDVVKLGS